MIFPTHTVVAFLAVVAPSLAADYPILAVVGEDNPEGIAWADSFSVDDQCYCSISTLEDSIKGFLVEWKEGHWATVEEICAALSGPTTVLESELGVSIPIYNDVQCGRGPPNDGGNEHTCPGRVDMGPLGCGQLGPSWNMALLEKNLGCRNSTETMVNATDDMMEDCGSDALMPLPDDAHPDIVYVLELETEVEPSEGWADSYSVGDECFCDGVSTLDHGIGTYQVETPMGFKTVQDVCAMLGPGPGISDSTPVYNDVQCGNGPPNNAGDEQLCPGRVDIGPEGCGHIGPKWNFEKLVTDAVEDVIEEVVEEVVVAAEEAPAPAPAPVVEEADSGGGLCFSGDTQVLVEGKGKILMSDLRVRDKVCTGGNDYQPVYAFAHYEPEAVHNFLQFRSDTGTILLEITSDHLVYVDGHVHPIRAGSVQVGDALLQTLQDTTRKLVAVAKIRTVIRQGLYAPLTPDGKILVDDNILASNYATPALPDSEEFVELSGRLSTGISQHTLTHLVLSPLRMICLEVTSEACENIHQTKTGKPTYVDVMLKLTAYARDNLSWMYQAFLLGAVFVLLAPFAIVEAVVPQEYWPIPYVLAMAAFVLGRKSNKDMVGEKDKSV